MWRAQKCKPWLGAKSAPNLTGLRTTPFYTAPYRAVNRNLLKLAASSSPMDYFQQIKVHMKRKLSMWRAKKCKPWVGAKGAHTLTGLHTTPFYTAPITAVNWNLRKFAASSCQAHYLHQIKVHMKRKVRMGRAQKSKPWIGAKGEPTMTGVHTTPLYTGPYRAVNGNLWRFAASSFPV